MSFSKSFEARLQKIIAQQLAESRYPLFYWTSKGKAEVDFIIEQDDKIYPLKVKFGASSKKKSLKIYGDSYHPGLLLRSSPMNLRQDGEVLNCPLYLIENLKVLISGKSV